MTNTEIIDCTTCKYGYEDEQLGIPMCHHPKRFSEDCVDFNMHEEKETKESEKPMRDGLENELKDYLRRYYNCDYPKQIEENTCSPTMPHIVEAARHFAQWVSGTLKEIRL